MSTSAKTAAGAVSSAVDALAYPAFYTRTAIFLHWLMALLIACGFSLGAYMVDLHMSPTKLRLYNYHKWIGITVLAFVLVRLVWRLTHRPPPEVAMPRWQLRAAQVHALPAVCAHDRDPCVRLVVQLRLRLLRGLPEADPSAGPGAQESATWPGYWCRYTPFWPGRIFWMVLLHVAAAFKHHFIDHDDTLRRMLAGVATEES